jgi:hypothetical protein
MIQNIIKMQFLLERKKQSVSTSNTIKSSCLEEKNSICSEKQTKPINTPRRQNAKLLNVNGGGSYNYRLALNYGRADGRKF